jgi:hypothetical protein
VEDARGHVDAVDDHVRHTQQVRQRLLLDAANARLQPRLLLGRLHLPLADVLDGAGQKAAGAAGRVEQRLAQARVDHVDGELGDGAGRVVLARVARALQVAQDLLVDVAEEVADLESLKSMSACRRLTTCRSSVPDFMYW